MSRERPSQSTGKAAPGRPGRPPKGDPRYEQSKAAKEGAATAPGGAPAADKRIAVVDDVEEKREAYKRMRAKQLAHGPAWVRRLEVGVQTINLAIAVALYDQTLSPKENEQDAERFVGAKAFSINIPTQSSVRAHKGSAGEVVVQAASQIIASYAPDSLSELIEHPNADAFAALADVAVSIAQVIVMRKLGPQIQELMRSSEQETRKASQETSNGAGASSTSSEAHDIKTPVN